MKKTLVSLALLALTAQGAWADDINYIDGSNAGK